MYLAIFRSGEEELKRNKAKKFEVYLILFKDFFDWIVWFYFNYHAYMLLSSDLVFDTGDLQMMSVKFK